MAQQSARECEFLHLRAEELDAAQINEQLDVVICLWNVLGHIRTASLRLRVLSASAQLLSPGGRLFIDVTHRYNARSYGVLPTLVRYQRDLIAREETAGDVTAKWDIGPRQSISTYGHLFTHREIMRLSSASRSIWKSA
jgi:hypothetical protein